MLLNENYHLTYCTNIHPGENWRAVFNSLERYVLPIKKELSPSSPFGIGLRLSDQASRELGDGQELDAFRQWLDEQGCYVFTMNGFPFGSFHRSKVKDMVHQPDWTTKERLDYSIRLFNQLAVLLPDGLEGGISTSPLSYKLWHSDEVATENAFLKSTQHLLLLADHLQQIETHTGKHLHLDIEPEPDGLLENTVETVDYYNRYLLPMGMQYFQDRFSPGDAETIVRRYINLCYDVCHFAVEYEDPEIALRTFREEQIPIGKVQISAALKANLPKKLVFRHPIRLQFESLNESTYLHQVIARHANGQHINYPDLPEALPHLDDLEVEEWRTHFHVPIFVQHFNKLHSTQDEILRVLELLKRDKFTKHLEVETYTWEVLPKELQTDLQSSITRELEWVMEAMK